MFVRQKILRSLLTVVCAISLPVSAAWAAGSVQVTVDKLNVRSGPSLQDAIVTTLPNKTVLPVISSKNDWIQVKLPNGQSGWVANWLVSTQQQQQPQQQKPATASAKQVESTTTNLNVRSGPGQTYAVVQTINPGTRYPIVQKSGEWIEIQLNAGTKGWVANWLVKEVGAGQAVSPPSTGITPPTTNPAGSGSQPKPPAVQGQPNLGFRSVRIRHARCQHTCYRSTTCGRENHGLEQTKWLDSIPLRWSQCLALHRSNQPEHRSTDSARKWKWKHATSDWATIFFKSKRHSKNGRIESAQ